MTWNIMMTGLGGIICILGIWIGYREGKIEGIREGRLEMLTEIRREMLAWWLEWKK